MLKRGRIHIDFSDEGESRNYPAAAEFVVSPPRLWPIVKLLAVPDLWVGESYAAGNWYLIKGDLSDFLANIQRDAKGPFKAYYDFVSAMRGVRHYLGQYILNRHYTRKVRRHYEVDSRIYEMILDDEMLYTCAFFTDSDESLAAAQQIKLAITIKRVALPDGPCRVLDIGCGWGGMARALTKTYSEVEICGLSISKGQIEWAKRADSERLTPQQTRRIEYRLEDYIDHNKRNYYDAVTVIGMIEHVGLGGYDEFFHCIHSFLKTGGTAVIHTIVSPLPSVPTNSWIDRHIFTGGYAPSISELVKAAEKQGLRITGVHIHRPMNYRRTIEYWLENFLNNISSVREYMRNAGDSEDAIDRFIRIWIFYLSGVRNMFIEDESRSHQVAQLCVKKLQE